MKNTEKKLIIKKQAANRFAKKAKEVANKKAANNARIAKMAANKAEQERIAKEAANKKAANELSRQRQLVKILGNKKVNLKNRPQFIRRTNNISAISRNINKFMANKIEKEMEKEQKKINNVRTTRVVTRSMNKNLNKKKSELISEIQKTVQGFTGIQRRGWEKATREATTLKNIENLKKLLRDKAAFKTEMNKSIIKKTNKADHTVFTMRLENNLTKRKEKFENQKRKVKLNIISKL